MTVEVKVDGEKVTEAQALISPVPYAKYADAVGTPECPPEYRRETDERRKDVVLCKRGRDEMVRVGRRRSAFWVDRYEASVFREEAGVNRVDGQKPEDYHPLLPNGQWQAGQKEPPLYALSVSGDTPARNLTWFQANEACAASGKALLTREEWFLAVQGTRDPAAGSTGSGGTCVTQAGGPRKTGDGTACESIWGVQDMIGNVWEWTAEWYASVGVYNPMQMQVVIGNGEKPWPAGYNDDRTWNIGSRVYVDGSGGQVDGMPAATSRGGGWEGTQTGAFALVLLNGPSSWHTTIGFRCAIRR